MELAGLAFEALSAHLTGLRFSRLFRRDTALSVYFLFDFGKNRAESDFLDRKTPYRSLIPTIRGQHDRAQWSRSRWRRPPCSLSGHSTAEGSFRSNAG